MKLLKWFTLIAVGLVVVGLGGLLLAMRAYPGSNLLGGWGLILGPVYWLGLLLCCFAALAWAVAGARWLWRRAVRHG